MDYATAAMLDDATLFAIVTAKKFAQPVKPVKPAPQPIDWAALAARASGDTPRLLGE